MARGATTIAELSNSGYLKTILRLNKGRLLFGNSSDEWPTEKNFGKIALIHFKIRQSF